MVNPGWRDTASRVERLHEATSGDVRHTPETRGEPMRAVRPLTRLVASSFAVAVALVVGTGVASAATTLTYDPDKAVPGTRVTISNACLGITDNPPAELQAAFIASGVDVSPTDPKVPTGVARAVPGTALYVVVVPDLTPGRYQILLECLPGDWRTNTAEGGTQPLRVLDGAPDTSTTPEAGGTARPPADGRIEVLVLLALGLAGGIAGWNRLSRGRPPAG
jgi:hypothetical protein